MKCLFERFCQFDQGIDSACAKVCRAFWAQPNTESGEFALSLKGLQRVGGTVDPSCDRIGTHGHICFTCAPDSRAPVVVWIGVLVGVCKNFA